MITGCNTNISHREMVFHVQTEDSGRANPHIISHVYYGGTIVGSRKQDYSDAVESPDLDREVRSRIEEQHKAMLKALLNGEFDQAIAGQLAERPRSVTVPDPATGVSDAGAAVAEQVDTAAAQVRQTGATTGNMTTPEVDTDPNVSGGQPVKTEKGGRPSAVAAFGESVGAQKPLDEVILEYLVDKARERSSNRRPPAKTRSKG
ncbi:MAG: hypothetical protein AAEJ52_17445 [Myxococcota bacterium]